MEPITLAFAFKSKMSFMRCSMLTMKPFSEEDRESYLTFSRDFYSGGAALHPIPDAHMQNTFNRLLEGMPYSDGYMLFWEDKRAGYALVSFLWSTEAGGLVAFLDELYVSPEFRGLGIGNLFLEQIEARYQGQIVGLRLEVCESNSGAIRLYRKHGYDDLDYRQMIKTLTEK